MKDEMLNGFAHESQLMMTRRQLFGRSALGLGTAAMAGLMGPDVFGAAKGNAKLNGGLHHVAKAMRVIYLFMNGAPTHTDLYDYKPLQEQLHGKPVPQDFVEGKRFSTMTGNPQGKLMLAPIEPFKQHGQSGAWVSNFMPHVGKAADDICFIKSMHTEQVNHAPAISFFMSGAEMPGRPTLGAWLSYGLGSDTDSLPSFVVMTSVSKGTTCGQIFYDFYWGSGFLPSRFQGVKFRTGGDPVLYLQNPNGITGQERRGMLDDLGKLNRMRHAEFGDPEILTRIAQYEMAFRMQSSVPDLTDLSGESKATLEMYGPNVTKPGTYAYSALLTRRLMERGVRVVQILHRGWDQHGSLPAQIKNQCMDTDQPTAALMKDLKQRGLLDDTLVVFGGEFGRTVYCQGKLTRENYGRDHHPRNFCMWVAGAGIKTGITHGATDDFSYNITHDPVHLNELNATILDRMGIDHSRFTFPFQGLDQRLTGVEEVHPIQALMV